MPTVTGSFDVKLMACRSTRIPMGTPLTSRHACCSAWRYAAEFSGCCLSCSAPLTNGPVRVWKVLAG